MWWPAVVRSEWELRLGCGRSPHAYVNHRLQIELELMMMSGMSFETCWAFNEQWNNKFYYKVASCWLFLPNIKGDSQNRFSSAVRFLFCITVVLMPIPIGNKKYVLILWVLSLPCSGTSSLVLVIPLWLLFLTPINATYWIWNCERHFQATVHSWRHKYRLLW